MLGNASINVKPWEGGGGTRADVGHLTSIVFPILGNLTNNLGPMVGMFAFYAEEWDQGTSSRVYACAPAISELK